MSKKNITTQKQKGPGGEIPSAARGTITYAKEISPVVAAQMTADYNQATQNYKNSLISCANLSLELDKNIEKTSLHQDDRENYLKQLIEINNKLKNIHSEITKAEKVAKAAIEEGYRAAKTEALLGKDVTIKPQVNLYYEYHKKIIPFYETGLIQIQEVHSSFIAISTKLNQEFTDHLPSTKNKDTGYSAADLEEGLELDEDWDKKKDTGYSAADLEEGLKLDEDWDKKEEIYANFDDLITDGQSFATEATTPAAPTISREQEEEKLKKYNQAKIELEEAKIKIEKIEKEQEENRIKLEKIAEERERNAKEQEETERKIAKNDENFKQRQEELRKTQSPQGQLSSPDDKGTSALSNDSTLPNPPKNTLETPGESQSPLDHQTPSATTEAPKQKPRSLPARPTQGASAAAVKTPIATPANASTTTTTQDPQNLLNQTPSAPTNEPKTAPETAVGQPRTKRTLPKAPQASR